MNIKQLDVPQQKHLFPAPWVPGTLPELPGEVNLVPISLLNRPLRVEFAEWNLAPGQPERPKATVSLLWDDVEVDSKVMEYPSYTAADLFPHVPVLASLQSGQHCLRYRIKTIFSDDTSLQTSVLIDRMPPSFNVPLGIVRLPAEVIAGGLTQAYLDAHGHQLLVRIGRYPDTRVQDEVLLYWRSPVRKDGDDVPLLVHSVTQQQADDAQADPDGQMEISVPEADIVRAGAGHTVLTYVLRDRAGNASPPSMTTSLAVSLEQPPPLQAPTVPAHDDGRVTRADAQAGVRVGVPAYTFATTDNLLINWGPQVSTLYPVGPTPSFPLYFSVPWEVLAVGNGAEVPYQVFRLDYRNAAPGDEITVFVQGFDGSGIQSLPGTDFTDQQSVDRADLATGYFEFVIPEAMFTRALFPGARNLVNIHYQVSNLAGRGESLLSRTLIDMRGDA